MLYLMLKYEQLLVNRISCLIELSVKRSVISPRPNFDRPYAYLLYTTVSKDCARDNMDCIISMVLWILFESNSKVPTLVLT